MKKITLTCLLLPSLWFTSAQAEISYAAILADPDNAVLNEQFARQRLAQGDAKAALAAVERVLVAEPGNIGARMFRAEVLAALGADLQAIGELRALGALPLPAAQRQRIGRLLKRVKERQKKTTTTLNLAFGYLHSDNASGWPDDGNILYNGQPLPDTNPYTQDRINSGEPITEATEDQALSQQISMSSSYDLGNQNWRSITVSGAYQEKSRGETGYLDGDTASLGLGMNFERGKFRLVPRASVSEVNNDFEDRLGSYDVHATSLTALYRLSATGRLTGSLARTRLLYEGDKKINDTMTLSGSLGYEQRIGAKTTLGLTLFRQNTDSDENNDLDKVTDGASLSLRMAVRRGHFLNANAAYLESQNDNVYSQSFDPRQGETAADGDMRADEVTSFGASYIVMGNSLHPRLDGLVLSAGVQHNETQSNLVGFSTERNIATLQASYGFRF